MFLLFFSTADPVQQAAFRIEFLDASDEFTVIAKLLVKSVILKINSVVRIYPCIRLPAIQPRTLVLLLLRYFGQSSHRSLNLPRRWRHATLQISCFDPEALTDALCSGKFEVGKALLNLDSHELAFRCLLPQCNVWKSTSWCKCLPDTECESQMGPFLRHLERDPSNRQFRQVVLPYSVSLHTESSNVGEKLLNSMHR